MQEELTVQELIDALQKVEEKHIKVVFKDIHGKLVPVVKIRTGAIGFLEGGVILSSE